MTKKAIRFTAPWCGPCKSYAPVFTKVSEENSEWTFESINVDDDHANSEKYGIRSIPATVIEIDGEVVDKVVGVLSSNQLQEKLQEWSK